MKKINSKYKKKIEESTKNLNHARETEKRDRESSVWKEQEKYIRKKKEG